MCGPSVGTCWREAAVLGLVARMAKGKPAARGLLQVRMSGTMPGEGRRMGRVGGWGG